MFQEGDEQGREKGRQRSWMEKTAKPTRRLLPQLSEGVRSQGSADGSGQMPEDKP